MPTAPRQRSVGTNTPASQAIAQGQTPFWEDSPEQWDTFVVQGKALPGIARVDAKGGRKIDVNSPPGADGARLRDKGYNPFRITVTLEMWTRDHLNEWQTIGAALAARRQAFQGPASTTSTTSASTRTTVQRNTRVALDVAHPALSDPAVNVRRAYLEEISALKLTPKKTMQVVLTFIEYRPPTATRNATAVQTGTLGQTSTAFDPNSTAQTHDPVANSPSRQQNGWATFAQTGFAPPQ